MTARAGYIVRFTDLSGYGSETRHARTLTDARRIAKSIASSVWGRAYYSARLFQDAGGCVARYLPQGAITGGVSIWIDRTEVTL